MTIELVEGIGAWGCEKGTLIIKQNPYWTILI